MASSDHHEQVGCKLKDPQLDRSSRPMMLHIAQCIVLRTLPCPCKVLGKTMNNMSHQSSCTSPSSAPLDRKSFTPYGASILTDNKLRSSWVVLDLFLHHPILMRLRYKQSQQRSHKSSTEHHQTDERAAPTILLRQDTA